jgi:hypothetical protein
MRFQIIEVNEHCQGTRRNQGEVTNGRKPF